MFDPNFIGIYDGTLSSVSCKKIIEYIESKPLVSGSLGFPAHSDKSRKDDWEVRVEDTHLDNATDVDILIIDALSSNTPKYRESYPLLNEIPKWGLWKIYNLQKYNPGQGYHAVHCENDGCEIPKVASRILAWTIYLNTVTEGGGTHFPHYNKTIDAKEGRMVIWPAYWTHMHHGIVSKTQTKYIITGWYNIIWDRNLKD